MSRSADQLGLGTAVPPEGRSGISCYVTAVIARASSVSPALCIVSRSEWPSRARRSHKRRNPFGNSAPTDSQKLLETFRADATCRMACRPAVRPLDFDWLQ